MEALLKKRLTDVKGFGKREAASISIRKQEQDTFLQNKREILLPSVNDSITTVSFDSSKIKELINSNDRTSVMQGLSMIQTCLSKGETPLLKEVDILTRLIQIITTDTDESFVRNALSIFCFLSSNYSDENVLISVIHTLNVPQVCIKIAEVGSTPPPPENPLFPNPVRPTPPSQTRHNITQLAFLTLANLCNVGNGFLRRQLIENNVHLMVMEWAPMLPAELTEYLEDAAWCLRAILLGQEIPLLHVERTVEFATRLLYAKQLSVNCYALMVLSSVFVAQTGGADAAEERNNRALNKCFGSGVPPLCIGFMSNGHSEVRLAAIQLLCRLTNSKAHHIQSLTKLDALQAIHERIVRDADERNRRLALFSLSNFAATSCSEVAAIMATGSFVSDLCELCSRGSTALHSEATFTLANMCQKATAEMTARLHELGVTGAFLEALKRSDCKPHVVCAGLIYLHDKYAQFAVERQVSNAVYDQATNSNIQGTLLSLERVYEHLPAAQKSLIEKAIDLFPDAYDFEDSYGDSDARQPSGVSQMQPSAQATQQFGDVELDLSF